VSSDDGTRRRDARGRGACMVGRDRNGLNRQRFNGRIE
jgi:hypothetical protein